MDEHAYFQAIEEHFIRLRGAPLLLSPADWQVAQEWRREGLPLELVLSALDEVFERRSERGSERPIQSLRYCASAVREAWQRSSKMEQAGRREEMPPLDLSDRLDALTAAIPAGIGGGEKIRRSIAGLSTEGAAAQEVETLLAQLDRELMAAALESLGEDHRAEIERGVERSLAAIGGRLTPDESEIARRRLREQALRRELSLPLLSLFAEL